MKISINIDPALSDTQIAVACPSITPEIEKLLATLRILERQMTVTKDDEIFILDVSNIIYMESVDRKTFVYTASDCYESKLRLYEVEQNMCECGFIRISKSCLVNIKFVRSLKSEINHKLRITLDNNEQIIVSRQYADEFKKKLGVK